MYCPLRVPNINPPVGDPPPEPRRPTTRYIDEEPEVDHALVCLSNEDPTHLRLGDDEEYSSDSD